MHSKRPKYSWYEKLVRGACIGNGVNSEWVRDLTEEGIEPHPGPRFITKNVNGLNHGPTMRRFVRNIAAEHQRDPITAIFIQEHHIKHGKAGALRNEARNAHLLVLIATIPSSATKGGTMIIIPHGSIEHKNNETRTPAVQRVRESTRYMQEGRGVSCHTIIEGRKYKLASIYAPSASNARPAFFEKLRRFITKKTILGIDANCVPDTTLDVKQAAGVTSAYDNVGADELNDVIIEKELIDVARECLGNEPFYTAHKNVAGGGVTHTRIDRIYMPDEDGLIWSHSSGLHDFFGTRPEGALELDHEPAQVRTCIATEDRGMDLEQINERVYDSIAFNNKLVKMIEETIERHDPENHDTWRIAWVDIKSRAKKMAISESAKIRYKDNKAIQALRSKRDQLKGLIDKGEADAAQITEYMATEGKIRDETKKARSLFETLEEVAYRTGKMHDTCTAAFYRPWTPKGAAHWVTKIFDADWTDVQNPRRTGTHTTIPKQIAATITKYYKALFKKPMIRPGAVNICLETLRSGNRVLPPTDTECGKPMTEEEIEDTMNRLPTGKSPGPDRLPNKFYKVLSKVLAPILTKVINESHEVGCFPPGFSDGTISILYKKKERDDPRNYRPITLLNGDYKVMTRVLATRMNKAVVQFVSDPQNGFVPDSFLPENIMLLKLIQAHVESEDEEAYFLFLDMEKAFDKCSWEFLTRAMKEIGFTDRFIDYVKLTYNHDNAPKRKLYVNGYLGPEFELGSGVAQGDPLSPLLFLLITEPMTRLFQRSDDIEGVTIGNVRYVISQYADDTTLILRPHDTEAAEHLLRVWQSATAMRENMGKREGQLLGALADNPENAPDDVVPKWLKNGDTLRALGAPMGNNFDVKSWYESKYRSVKNRVALWPSMRRLSLTGRNMLLQSIFYGSFRFYLYFIEMPYSLVTKMETDAKQILWATQPEFHTDEIGTSKRSRRYIREAASYLPTRKGGGGIMHWLSHANAFYAEWIIRYLHPRRAPWKHILTHWIENEKEHGLSKEILLTELRDRRDYIPNEAKYIKRCLTAFLTLNVTQNTSTLDNSVRAENLYFNNRFEMPLRKSRREKWIKREPVTKIGDMFTAEGSLISDDTWKSLWTPPRGNRIKDLQTIKDNIPSEVVHACRPPPQPRVDATMAVMRDGQLLTYVRVKETNGGHELEELWLDLSQRPHHTGKIVTLNQDDELEEVTEWDDTPTDPPPMYGSQHVPEKEPPQHAIIGPESEAFPRNDGWYPEELGPANDKGDKYKLSDLTIHQITDIFTKPHINGAQPSCIEAWKKRLGNNLQFDKIFASFGTPLSDPTEERQWRKLVHRGINVHNRNRDQDNKCRVCNTSTESMLHLFECRHIKPFWKKCMDFITGIIGAPQPQNHMQACILGQWSAKELGPIEALAFLRHAFNQLYHDFSNVDLKNYTLDWLNTYRDALLSFRDAVLRRGRHTRLLYSHRRYTNLPSKVPKEEREKYSSLVSMSEDGNCTLTAEFEREIKDAIDTAGAHADANTARNNRLGP